MRVLIFEPDHEGHRLQYVRTMLPGLLELSDHVTVALPADALASREFAVHLAGACAGVHFDTKLHRAPGAGLKNAKAKFDAFRAAIERCRPDHVYVPYGDGLAQFLGIPGAWRRAVSRGVEVETLLLRGAVAYPGTTVKERLKGRLSFAAAVRPPWSALFHLDPIVYEWVAQRGGALASRLQLMPDPVEPPGADDRATVLHRLGLPDDGRYVGAAGVMNRHKGIDLLLKAFAIAKLPATDRLLLAGRQTDDVRALLDGEFAPLVRSGRIISLDRVLPTDDIAAAIAAMDVVCVPYPRHIGSASIVIRAAAAARPVLATDFGWCGYVVPRFDLGRVVDVKDPAAFATTLSRTLEEAGTFRLSEAGERFVGFHTPDNFRAHWTAGLRRRMNLPPRECRSWASVLGPQGDHRVGSGRSSVAPAASQWGVARA